MSGFIAIAGVLTLAALAALLFPLLRRRQGSAEAWRSGGVVAALIAVGAAALYPLWSNFDWYQTAPAADTPQAMVGRLARRLEKEPNDLQGWLQLGRSYLVLEQFPLAVRAYERANALSSGQSSEAAMGLAEALFNNGDDDLSGRVGRLFEQALEVDPDSTKALFYSALAAAERNEVPLARQRFQRMLDANLPDNVRDMIQGYVDQLGVAAPTTASSASSAPSAPGPAPAASVVTVPLQVTLSGKLAIGPLPAGARLFVSARLPGRPGPPLASSQPLQPRFPQDVDLRSTDSPMGGDGFQAGQEIEIKAHVSLKGGAVSQTGDPFGTVRLKAGSGARTTLEINQLTR